MFEKNHKKPSIFAHSESNINFHSELINEDYSDIASVMTDVSFFEDSELSEEEASKLESEFNSLNEESEMSSSELFNDENPTEEKETTCVKCGKNPCCCKGKKSKKFNSNIGNTMSLNSLFNDLFDEEIDEVTPADAAGTTSNEEDGVSEVNDAFDGTQARKKAKKKKKFRSEWDLFAEGPDGQELPDDDHSEEDGTRTVGETEHDKKKAKKKKKLHSEWDLFTTEQDQIDEANLDTEEAGTEDGAEGDPSQKKKAKKKKKFRSEWDLFATGSEDGDDETEDGEEEEATEQKKKAKKKKKFRSEWDLFDDATEEEATADPTDGDDEVSDDDEEVTEEDAEEVVAEESAMLDFSFDA